MKNRWLIVLGFIACLFLFPSVVFAAEVCSDNQSKITEIEMVDAEGIVVETASPDFEDQKINLNLKFYELNSTVAYKVTIRNDSKEDYYIDEQDFLKDYINYKIELPDGSNVIAGESEKEVYLIAKYTEEVPQDQFQNNELTGTDNINLIITNRNTGNLVNPETKNPIALMLFILISVSLITFVQHKKIKNDGSIIIGIILLLLPITISALCKYTINLTSNVTISNEQINVCSYDGPLEVGAEYINGDYTYRYRQRKTENGWEDMEEEGWGVSLTNNNTFAPITSEVCTIVDHKPIIDENYMERLPEDQIDYLASASTFKNGLTGVQIEKLTFLDHKNIPDNATKSWDVSNKRNGAIMAWYLDEDGNGKYELYIGANGGVNANPNMYAYFGGLLYVEETNNLNLLEVSGVTNMSMMFDRYASNVSNVELDFTGWNTSRVTNMAAMFSNATINSDSVIIKGLDTWDVSSVTSMLSMFVGVGKNASYWSLGQFDNWDTKNVTDMRSMFYGVGENATSWESIGTLNVYSGTTIGGGAISEGFFSYCRGVNGTINFHGDPGNIRYAFDTAAEIGDSKITVNYTEDTTKITQIINTKSRNGNVVKGSIIE